MGNLEMMSTDEEAAYQVGLEFKQRLDKLERDFEHFKPKPGATGEKGSNGYMGPKGQKGTQGEKGQQGIKGDNGQIGLPGLQGPTGIPGTKGDSGITTIKHIYEPLPKEIEEKLGSLGTVASASDAEKRANKLLDDIEFMKTEIHTMYKEKYEELKKAQEPPKKKSVFKRLFRRD